MTSNSILIQNPLPFMIEKFMKKNVLNGKYASGKIQYILKDDLPNKILISFEKENLCESFISDYNEKYFDENLNYELKIEKCEKTYEEIKKEISQNITEYQPYKFDIQYEKEWKLDYVNSPEKPGLLYINEEAKNKIYKTFKFLITKFGKNLFEGKSIINVSFPIFLYDKRTYAQVLAYEHKLAPYFLSKAALCKDKMDKFKYVITHLFALLHISTIQTQPFKPVVGETFQCRIGNFVLYIENTSSDSLVNNFYGYDDEKNYKIYGYQISDISTMPNSVIASKLGKYYIEFKDGSKYLLRLPNITLKGISMGDRTFNYTEKIVIFDLNNNLCAFVEMNPEEVGFFKSFFKKKNTFPDYFKGDIVESNFVKMDEKGCNHILNKGYKSLCKIEGEWTSSIRFDDIEYWDIDDYELIQMYHYGYLLPSDSSLRLDLINFIKDDQEKSQIEKEKIEADAERDINLRKKNSN
jgi:hypothetical protein